MTKVFICFPLRVTLLALLLSVALNSLADPPPQLDTETGGGMGGTGNSTTDSADIPLAPLNSKTETPCSSIDIIGSYQISKRVTDYGFASKSLCLNTVIVLNEDERILLELPSEHKISIKTTGISRLQFKKSSHHVWESRLEIEITPLQGKADVTINSTPFLIPFGFVGSIWIEGSQAFWGLQKTAYPQ